MNNYNNSDMYHTPKKEKNKLVYYSEKLETDSLNNNKYFDNIKKDMAVINNNFNIDKNIIINDINIQNYNNKLNSSTIIKKNISGAKKLFFNHINKNKDYFENSNFNNTAKYKNPFNNKPDINTKSLFNTDSIGYTVLDSMEKIPKINFDNNNNDFSSIENSDIMNLNDPYILQLFHSDMNSENNNEN